jgi:hypothetical protein
MTMYTADPAVMRRATDLLRKLRRALRDCDSAAGSSSDQLRQLLEGSLEAELELWCSDEATADLELRATIAAELAATWVCLEHIRFQSAAVLVESSVAESWPDKLEAWREHGREVAATIGASSGDWGAALAYLHHYTDELLGRRDGPW